jgi:Transglutaminase-like superfamily
VRGGTWKSQSKFTDPGAAGAVIDELPADLAALRGASSELVFHYRGDGDWAENGVPAERAGEIDTRYADAMFALLLSRGEPTLARKRLPPDRVVGCCRDATLLFVSLARRKGIPARMRVGFAAYFHRAGCRPESGPPFDEPGRYHRVHRAEQQPRGQLGVDVGPDVAVPLGLLTPGRYVLQAEYGITFTNVNPDGPWG